MRATDAAGNLSAYSNIASATTPAQDTQPPTAPSNLTATSISSNQINLAWTASTDNVGVTGYRVERCSGAGCTTFAQIGTPTSTTFSDTGLTASTSYSYRVRATDAAGNLSAYSNTASATTTATTGGPIKFIQGNFQAPQSSPTSVAVTYTGAQSAGDLNVVVVGWNDASTTVSSVTDTMGNTYTLAVGPTVQPGPAGGGGLSQSIYYAKNIASATANGNAVTVRFSAAAAFPDVRILEYSGLSPTSPLDVTAAAVGNSATSSSGTATTTSANELLVGANMTFTITTGPGAGFTSRMITTPDGDIAEDRIVTATGSYQATAPVGAGPWIMQMATFSASATSVDTTPPTAPSGLTATAASASQINLAWAASTDNVGVTGYRVERCSGAGCTAFAQIGTSTSTTFSDTGLTASTSYSYRVRATDAAGNLSAYSNTASATTSDTQPPTAPSSLTATSVSVSQINLAWTASTDNVGVTGYRVERCSGAGCTTFAQIGTPTSTTFSDTGLTASTSYSYRVRATDAAGNLSAYSNIASATTPAQDTQPPTAPSNLTATSISSNQINLAWTASTDNVGVTGYRVERCSGAGCTAFAQIGTPTSTTFSDTGLTASTSYSYRVRATDAAGNLSAYSNTASATTTATTGGPIKFIQGNFQAPQSSPTSVAVTYTGAQSAGDLNVVVVGWNDASTTVSSVTDTMGNTYTLAVGPTVQPGPAGGGGLSQSIYYAKNIASATANGNAVTVRFSAAAAFPDVRILEYSGLSPTSPLDVTAAAVGNSATSSSGTATTTSANELLVGANMTFTITTGPGAGFTSRMITTPDGDIAEDRIVTATGSYQATAPVGAGPWIMQLVGFRAP